MAKPATNVHRLIVDLWHRPEVEARFNTDRNAVFDEYGLTEEERQSLQTPAWAPKGQVGIAPISQILYCIKAFPPVRQHLSMANHFDRFNAEIRDKTSI